MTPGDFLDLLEPLRPPLLVPSSWWPTVRPLRPVRWTSPPGPPDAPHVGPNPFPELSTGNVSGHRPPTSQRLDWESRTGALGPTDLDPVSVRGGTPTSTRNVHEPEGSQSTHHCHWFRREPQYTHHWHYRRDRKPLPRTRVWVPPLLPNRTGPFKDSEVTGSPSDPPRTP